MVRSADARPRAPRHEPARRSGPTFAYRAALVVVAAALGAGAAAGGPLTAVIVSAGPPVFGQALAGVQRGLGESVPVFDLASIAAQEVASRLAAERPRVIIAIGSDAMRVAEQADARVPIVAVLVPHLERAPADAARTVYGIGLFAPASALLGQIAKLAPRARTLWTIYSPASTGESVQRLRAAAPSAGYLLVATEAADAAAAVRALRSPPEGVGAFVMLPDPVVRNSAFDQALLRLAFERRFPAVGASRADVRAGALFALQLDPKAIGAQAADVARDLLRSPTPPEPGVVPPSGYVLVINAATARHLGIEIPDPVRKQAAEVLGE